MKLTAKDIEEKYGEWCGKHHLENSNLSVHDSAEVVEFALQCCKVLETELNVYDALYGIVLEENDSIAYELFETKKRVVEIEAEKKVLAEKAFIAGMHFESEKNFIPLSFGFEEWYKQEVEGE
jgi:hypothetical protein